MCIRDRVSTQSTWGFQYIYLYEMHRSATVILFAVVLIAVGSTQQHPSQCSDNGNTQKFWQGVMQSLYPNATEQLAIKNCTDFTLLLRSLQQVSRSLPHYEFYIKVLRDNLLNSFYFDQAQNRSIATRLARRLYNFTSFDYLMTTQSQLSIVLGYNVVNDKLKTLAKIFANYTEQDQGYDRFGRRFGEVLLALDVRLNPSMNEASHKFLWGLGDGFNRKPSDPKGTGVQLARSITANMSNFVRLALALGNLDRYDENMKRHAFRGLRHTFEGILRYVKRYPVSILKEYNIEVAVRYAASALNTLTLGGLFSSYEAIGKGRVQERLNAIAKQAHVRDYYAAGWKLGGFLADLYAIQPDVEYA
eukprot:TRINITY_DN6977_c0_g1_i1.p1 TRINITY_DN6977_c0_g1~~TRINITY_DN6977_c0_g1_i1.p1  ORF type:complete len:361 (-),score=102.66 TRINITY_DN6977_c0_g1_i1:204-1286(-)